MVKTHSHCRHHKPWYTQTNIYSTCSTTQSDNVISIHMTTSDSFHCHDVHYEYKILLFPHFPFPTISSHFLVSFIPNNSKHNHRSNTYNVQPHSHTAVSDQIPFPIIKRLQSRHEGSMLLQRFKCVGFMIDVISPVIAWCISTQYNVHV